MTTLLETTHSNGKEIKIWHSDHIALRPVLSLLFKGYAKLFDQKFLFPSVNWESFGNSMVMWITNAEEKIIGGIHYALDNKEYNAGVIRLVFIENENEYTEEVHGFCLEQLKKIIKQHNLGLLIQQVHIDNQVDMDLAFSAGLKPSFYFLSRSLVDDD